MNRRIDRIREEIKKEVSNILLYDLKDPRLRGMASVISVKVTNDLSYCTIYVSVLGDQSEKEDSMKAVKSAEGFVRRELSKRLGIRYVPEIKFELDESIDKSIRINEILNSLKQD
ncbi:MAG: 30S ribosome-binding factor RbfA [Clostridia bacterium]|nr:30S ribosome-binding factor RbfA [Clostridia bacterium]